MHARVAVAVVVALVWAARAASLTAVSTTGVSGGGTDAEWISLNPPNIGVSAGVGGEVATNRVFFTGLGTGVGAGERVAGVEIEVVFSTTFSASTLASPRHVLVTSIAFAAPSLGFAPPPYLLERDISVPVSTLPLGGAGSLFGLDALDPGTVAAAFAAPDFRVGLTLSALFYAADGGSPGPVTRVAAVWSTTLSVLTLTTTTAPAFCLPDLPWPLTPAAATAALPCGPGYSGTHTRLCSPVTHAWTPPDNACTPLANHCPLLPLPAPPSCAPSRAPTDTCASASCPSGYTLAGAASRTCSIFGSWSGASAACIPNGATCPPPPPLSLPLGLRSTCTPTTDALCRTECAPGAVSSAPSPVSTAACAGATSAWTPPLPACSADPAFCPPLAPIPAAAPPPPHAHTLGTTTPPYVCNATFTRTGPPARTCVPTSASAGVWSDAPPACLADPSASCPDPPDPPNSIRTSCARSDAATCSFACAAGYASPPPAPTATITCSVGSWSVLPPAFSCSPIDPFCPPLTPPPDGSLVANPPPTLGALAAAACNDGYVLSGSAIRTCTLSGAWSGTPPTCAPIANHCPPRSFPAFSLANACDTTVGGECSFTCPLGYTLTGTDSITCTPSGAWSAPFGSCTPVTTHCPSPPPLANGATGACDRSIGGVCGPAACNAGFALTGSASRTCTPDGTWTGEAPACVASPAVCPLSAVPQPTNGYRGVCDPQAGGTCSFSCAPGYTLSAASRSCAPTGSWSGAAPTCTASTAWCSAFTVAHAAPGGCTRTVGSSCPVSCNGGYTRVGPAALTCGVATHWLPAPAFPFCTRTVPAHTVVVSDQAVATPADGQGWTFTVGLLDAANATVADLTDVVVVLRASTPPSLYVASAAPVVWIPAQSAYRVTVLSTQAGTSLFNVVVNGVVVGASPYALTVTPGAPSAATSTAAGDSGLGLVTVLPLAGTVLSFAVAPADAFGNAITLAPAPPTSPFAASIKSDAGTVVTIDYVAAASGPEAGYVYEYAAPGGLYTLTIGLGGAPIVGAPWLVQIRAVCEPGFSLTRITGPCIECFNGTYMGPVQDACRDCPPRHTSPRRATSLANCTCLPGAYRSTEPEPDPAFAPLRRCKPCPRGASCAGGEEAPVADTGFAPTDDPALFVECPRRASCLRGDACARGYRGPLCEECAADFYKLSTRCVACDRARAWVLAVVGVAMLFVFVSVLMFLNSRESHNRMYTAAAFMIGFNSLQISALYGDIDVEWHSLAKSFFNGLSIANLNIELAAPECSFSPGDPWLFKFVLTLLIPLFLVALIAASYAAALVYKRLVFNYGIDWAAGHPRFFRAPGESWPDGKVPWKRYAELRFGRLVGEARITKASLFQIALRTLFQLCVFFYLPLAAMVLRFFECEQFGRRWVLASNPDVACYDTRYWTLLPVVVLATLGYVIAIPVGTFVTLSRQKAKLDVVAFFLRYGFLVARFRASFYAFEVGIMARKLAVVAALVVFADPKHEASGAAVVLVVALVHVAYASPYGRHFHNQLEVAAMFSGVVVLVGATIEARSLRDVVVLAGLFSNLLILAIGIIVEFRNMAFRNADDLAALTLDDAMELAVIDPPPADSDNDAPHVEYVGKRVSVLDRMFAAGGDAPANPVFAAAAAPGGRDRALTSGVVTIDSLGADDTDHTDDTSALGISVIDDSSSVGMSTGMSTGPPVPDGLNSISAGMDAVQTVV